MATYGDEPVDSYFYSSHNPYTGRYPRSREPAWKYKRYLSHYGDASDAFNNQQRAQLKSILSQINPKLTPRLRKANTKDVAVQVRPKKDAAVQCSIGPRSLTAMKRDLKRKKADENQAGSQGQEEVGCGESPPPPEEEPPQPPEEDPEETAKTPLQRKRAKDKLAADESTQEGSKGKARVRFQFLEQKYGYYHCRECNVRWESAYVWCVQGTNKVYFKQYCRKCQKEFNPYRVEDITCHTCQKARCCCAVTQRHVDPKRPHRQDLCGRCKGKRLSCDSTFSFKYII
ncbi:zygote arrest protein 1 isoform X2 [Synchiropus splendidus]|uniref:zygote arrest protein 1 isoform X2 n=1 Tax=Synchiropus splendidus TaxID=270530 RepID=UPI00237E69BD|nr:zygote arrest protein 1 isoform X2 [Synchiropus splendidus]